ALQAAFLDDNPGVGAVGASADYIDQDGRSQVKDSLAAGPAVMRWLLLFGNPILHSGVMFRRDLAVKLGGYDQGFAYAQDYNLWSRLCLESDIVRLAEVLVRSRRHAGALSARRKEEQAEFGNRTRQANMERLLGRAVDLEVIRAFNRRTRVPGQCRAGARLVLDLWQAAQERWPLSPRERSLIRAEAADQLRGLAGLQARTLPWEAAYVYLRAVGLGLYANRHKRRGESP
ncbi:MAG: hypothetical protein JRJ59_10275, partial [Deltaproteobacteria bacterium]|nr:hypothetical protein [Deltaproteobacteria bacterium]